MAVSEYNLDTANLPCAFCGLGLQLESTSTSHGICLTCARNLLDVAGTRIVTDDAQKFVMVPVVSNNISEAGWRNVANGRGVLRLHFTSGIMFRYANVPHHWWQAFLQAESKGAFFHSTVRADPAAYPFTKITIPTGAAR